MVVGNAKALLRHLGMSVMIVLAFSHEDVHREITDKHTCYKVGVVLPRIIAPDSALPRQHLSPRDG